MSGSFGKGNHLHLIDGSAFIFRAYHALPPLTRKSDGLPIGAVAGHAAAGVSRHDMKSLGELLDKGGAGLLVVYAANRADQVTAALKAANVIKCQIQNARLEELAEAVNDAKSYTVPKTPAKV